MRNLTVAFTLLAAVTVASAQRSYTTYYEDFSKAEFIYAEVPKSPNYFTVLRDARTNTETYGVSYPIYTRNKFDFSLGFYTAGKSFERDWAKLNSRDTLIGGTINYRTLKVGTVEVYSTVGYSIPLNTSFGSLRGNLGYGITFKVGF